MVAESEDDAPPNALRVEPIGVVRSPFVDKQSAPRQPDQARGVEGTLELYDDPRYDYALSDLESWSHIWVVFWFHLNDGWRPKVRPPRSIDKRGVFATRAPHRPNPIGLSALELIAVEGRSIRVRNVDIVDGTPVLDIKPYVAYSDAIPEAGQGWLAERPDVADSGPRYDVQWSSRALERVAWLDERGANLRPRVNAALALGPTPHPYRRIKQDGKTLRMALKDWRVRFTVDDGAVTIHDVTTGYRARALRDPETEQKGEMPLDLHRAFLGRFGGSEVR